MKQKHSSYSLFLPIYAVVAYLLLLFHHDYLYAVSENDLFIGGRSFMLDTLNKPGGLWTWLGCFFTQFFHYPWLGALLLVGIWAATWLALQKAFRLESIQRLWLVVPISALLTSVIDLGYWMYYIEMPGYWFAQSLSFLGASLLTLILSWTTRRVTKRNLAWLYFAIVYFVVGQRFPEFRQGRYENHLLQLPFVIAPLAVVATPLLSFIHINIVSRRVKEALAVTLASAVFLVANCCSFRNANFTSELRMLRAMDEMQWDEIIAEAQEAKNPTNLMVMCKNIALLHTGRMTEMFKTGNCGTMPETGDSLQVFISHQAAPTVYYNLGQTNYAYRWAMENSVTHGMKVCHLKTMVRCALLNHEFDIAAKYLALLRSTMFNKEWVKRYEPMLTSSTLLMQSADYQLLSPLMTDGANQLDVDNGLPEKWILDHYSDIAHPQNDKLEELVLCTALWTEDDYSFCVNFYEYAQRHGISDIPELYQEALLLFGNSQQSIITLKDFPFSPVVQQRYNTFVNEYTIMQQVSTPRDIMAARLRGAFGGTYWWYYYFYRDFNIY